MKYLSFMKNMRYLAMFFLLLNANALTAEELSEGANNPDGAESSGRWDDENGDEDHDRHCGCDDCCAGPQGPPGTPGTNGTSPIAAYGYVWRSTLASNLVGSLSPVTFNNNGPLLNITHAANAAALVVALPGAYAADFSVFQDIGLEEDVDSIWQIYVNGAPVAGTLFSTTSAPVAGLELSGHVILNLPANASVTLVNASGDSVTLNTPAASGGAVLASLRLIRL